MKSGQIDLLMAFACAVTFRTSKWTGIRHDGSTEQGELPMRDHSHSQFTVFGGSFITEDHGCHCLPQPESKRSAAKAIAVAGLLMLGVTTATATKLNWPAGGLWDRGPHIISVASGLEDSVY
jgi:hypothetical protein